MNVFGSGIGLMGAVALGLLGTASAPALAVPLDATACEQLQAEFDTLRNEGAATDMARGPEWARANLPLGGLQRVQKYIEVEEQLNFRCGLAKTRITLPTTIEGGEEEIPAPGEAASGSAPGGVALPQRAPAGQKRPANAAAAVTVVPKTPAQQPSVQKAVPQKAPAPKAAPTAASATVKSSEKSATAPKAKPKPTAEGAAPPKKKAPVQSDKKQPQVDDAYRPPARPVTSDQTRAPPPARQ